MSADRIHLPGPSILDTVTVGGYNAIELRASIWDDGDITLHIETGAVTMQVTCRPGQLDLLRNMLTATLERAEAEWVAA